MVHPTILVRALFIRATRRASAAGRNPYLPEMWPRVVCYVVVGGVPDRLPRVRGAAAVRSVYVDFEPVRGSAYAAVSDACYAGDAGESYC